MSSYAYYRERPGWGTQQFQFAPPPVPAFRPEPTWGGRDYYSAAAMSPDLGVFDTAYNRIRAGGSSYNGVGFHDARSAHRRAYGGLGELNMMLPNELGAAAGYEAYRNWVHNSSVYEPTRFDDERQREALIGLAMAEATRLWNSAGRRLDRYGMQEACEAAAATVTVIMDQWRDPYAMTSSIPYSNTSSPYSSSVSVGSTDPYADDEIAFRRAHSPSRRHHHHHHRRRSSTNMAPGLVSGGAGAVPIPMPGTHQSPYGAPMPLSGTGMSPNTYGGMPVSVSVSPYGATIAQPQLVNTVPQMVYNTQPQPQPQPQPAQVFPAPMPQSSTIILQPTSSSRHRHGHHHKHRSRSRTRDSGHDHHHHRSRRYSDAATYYYGQPSTGTSGLIAAPRVMNTGGSMGMPVTYGQPVVAPSYTTAYRY